MRFKRRGKNGADAGSAIGPAQIVEALEGFGAEFRFTPAGSLIVRDLGKAPTALREMFFQCDGAQLMAFVRGRRRSEAETGSGGVFPARG